MRIPVLAAALAFALPAWAHEPAPAAEKTVQLKAPSGAALGTVRLTDAPKGVLMRLEVGGLAPGWHGLHFHEKADCSNADFTSAGGHVHPGGDRIHGLLNHKANEFGDLPNLHVGADGRGAAEVLSTFVSLAGLSANPRLLDEDGSAIVIHADPDDHMSQPIGGAGARVACAPIE